MKNINNVETVDKTRHAKLRVKPNADFAHAKEMNLAAISMGELSACTCNFPVVFIQNPENQQVRPVAMFGLRPGENVYYNADGWDSTYVPLLIQRHPFVIGFDDRSDDPKLLGTCLHRNSPFLSESEGVALFTPEGAETDYLQSRHLMMRDIFEGEKYTDQFVRKLQELGLLAPLEIIVQPESGELRRVAGIMTVSERKLRELTEAQLQELHKADFLPACYVILGSVFQLHRLMYLRNKKGIERIVNYRIDLEPPAPQKPAA